MKKKVQVPVPAPNPDKVFWVILGIALLIVLYARLSLLGIPLERDEGGFAYIGQRLFGSQTFLKSMKSATPGMVLQKQRPCLWS